MTEREIMEFLWKLLDDIDTMDDAAKNDDAAYRRAVGQIQNRRWEVGTSDGSAVRFISDGTTDDF